MKLILTEDDGTVLDSIDVSRQDWRDAKADVLVAYGLLSELKPDGR